MSRADRVAVLVDGEAYFSALADALEHAERSVHLLGWELHSDVELRPGADDPLPLHAALLRATERSPSLEVHALAWKGASMFWLEREPLHPLLLDWKTNERVHVCADDRHPWGGSSHQKIVVIDEQLAFIGGIDLTQRRWDRRGHPTMEAGRVTPGGEPYPPFHDVQLMLSGPVVEGLSAVVRGRWRTVTGEQLEAAPADGDRWPGRIRPDFQEVDVALSRTRPPCAEEKRAGEQDGGEADATDPLVADESAWDPGVGVQEIEQLYLDTIAAAEETIYIENQYLSSFAIVDALCRRLQDPAGPEIVLVNPEKLHGRLVRASIEVLRARALELLEAADAHGRFMAVAPLVGDDYVKVHAKLMIVDDALLRVGSSNITNRSLRLDLECDATLLSGDDLVRKRRLRGLRRSLIAEHLGVATEVVAAAEAEHRSMVRALAALCETHNGGDHRLGAIDVDNGSPLVFVEPEWGDASCPLGEAIVATVIPAAQHFTGAVPDLFEDDDGAMWQQLRAPIAILTAVLALAAAWAFTPLSEVIEPSALIPALQAAADAPFGWLSVTAVCVALSLLMVPLVPLVVSLAALFGPLLGLATSMVLALTSAAFGYGGGRWLGSSSGSGDAFAGEGRVRKLVNGGGVLSIIALRLVPIAPYTAVNLAAGHLRVPFARYLIGTAIGVTPAVAGLVLASDRVVAAIRDPSPLTLAMATAVVLVVVGALFLLRRWLIKEDA